MTEEEEKEEKERGKRERKREEKEDEMMGKILLRMDLMIGTRMQTPI